jgi:hypothetical protein
MDRDAGWPAPGKGLTGLLEGVGQRGDPSAEQPVLTARDLDRYLVAAWVFADREVQWLPPG